jgi:cytosine deaminase
MRASNHLQPGIDGGPTSRRFALLLTDGRIQPSSRSSPERLNIAIDAGRRIAGLGANLDPGSADRVIALGGKLVTPGLVDVHQHLDKSRTRHLVDNPNATLEGASAGYRALAATATRDQIAARAERTLENCLARGTVAIRSHTNIESETELRGIEAMIAVRERWQDRLTLQVVAHLTGDAPRRLAACRQWLDGAIAAGVDVIGGVPQYADDPFSFLDLIFEFAERSGLPVDLHVDEHLDGQHILLDAIIARTRSHGMRGRVTAGHCCALSAVDSSQARRLIDGLLENDIAVVTLPTANLFLQGRTAGGLAPRGLTRVNELSNAGVRVAAASDNIQDPFIPVGSGDLLEVARWTMVAAHFGLHDLGRAFDMVSAVPAAIMELGANWGLKVGARADLLISDAEDIHDLVAAGPLQRTVMVAGRLVAGTL